MSVSSLLFILFYSLSLSFAPFSFFFPVLSGLYRRSILSFSKLIRAAATAATVSVIYNVYIVQTPAKFSFLPSINYYSQGLASS